MAHRAHGATRFAATLFARRAATHFTFQTHDMRRIGELGKNVPRLPFCCTTEAGFRIGAVACVHRWEPFQRERDEFRGPKLF